MPTELPLFPTTAAPVFSDTRATTAMFAPVLRDLATIVEVPAGLLAAPTPCESYAVGELRTHVLAWLQFFAAALNDPDGATERIDPATWRLAAREEPATIVSTAADDIARAVTSGVASRIVVMSEARMAGAAVLAMALGEYLIHGWDLAVATRRSWPLASDPTSHAAIVAAHDFLQTMVAPEYRGDGGFFGAELAAPQGARPFEQLLCFAGRDPSWAPR